MADNKDIDIKLFKIDEAARAAGFGPLQPEEMQNFARALTQGEVSGIADQAQRTGTFQGTQAPVFSDTQPAGVQAEQFRMDQERVGQEMLRRGVDPSSIDDNRIPLQGQNLAKRPRLRGGLA